MSITSDEVNFLVYRYLLESGFQHSAFTFGLEAHVHQSSINGSAIPPGALIAVLQKGLQYVEAEVSIAEDGTDLSEKDLPPLSLVDAVTTHHDLTHREGGKVDGGGRKVEGTTDEGTKKGKDEAMDIDHDQPATLDLPSNQVTVLKGHESEVFTCAWSPSADIIVSGSGDSTARLWKLGEGGVSDHTSSIVLPHQPVDTSSQQEVNRDVTTIHWNADGSLLATGAYDGVARIWTCEGELRSTLAQHSGPIFALKWNPKGSCIVTGGVDKTAIVWDVQSGEVKQQFSLHKAPTLDVDWQSNTCFASCSSDKLIHVCKLGTERPQRTFQGHKNGVNAVKWDPSATLLASCSDDHTAKIWNMKSESWLHDLREHSGDIYTLQWSPTGPGSNNPSANPMLATASFDSTVRLWEVEKGACLHTLHKHQDPVYSIAFSPDGKLIASASVDMWLYVWSTLDGSLVRQYKGASGIFEVCWSKAGDKLAACYSNSTVCVLDLRSGLSTN